MEEMTNIASEAGNQIAGIFAVAAAWAASQVEWFKQQTTAVKVIALAVVGVVAFAVLSMVF